MGRLFLPKAKAKHEEFSMLTIMEKVFYLLKKDIFMTKEELLKPRYKVIADYPNSRYQVGRVVDFIFKHGGWRHEYVTHEGLDYDYVSTFEEYPHIFKKLEWWEERDEKDIPDYVKSATGHFYYCGNKKDWKEIISSSFYQPVTEKEYNDNL